MKFGDACSWRKSTASGGAGDCVEVAAVTAIAVRDSKDPDGPVLLFTTGEWEAFLFGVRAGEFDLTQL
ncbi:hypothetical protein HNP84_008400 [Thermocatellispora tengchongensis]|uniref:DUF397 domain-containing protein n=1 Tax=Thermocatellispora tengchongensis TaxID=1073253 RepID=A0A840PIG8_9ACTN|nr:DUF397 domain-containing protein [Thermocatellispora tengchongensis]MBB5138646.1 hypothetical protein [Thermocatellispora tengchongensis]